MHATDTPQLNNIRTHKTTEQRPLYRGRRRGHLPALAHVGHQPRPPPPLPLHRPRPRQSPLRRAGTSIIYVHVYMCTFVCVGHTHTLIPLSRTINPLHPQLLDAHLSRPVYKHILGVPITHHDLEVRKDLLFYIDGRMCVLRTRVCGKEDPHHLSLSLSLTHTHTPHTQTHPRRSTRSTTSRSARSWNTHWRTWAWT
jgi:hypothetical protein